MAADTVYNWPEAEILGKNGWAVRRRNWRQWLVFRGHGWEFVSWVGDQEQWRVPQATDMTDEEYLAKDYVTEPWEDGTRPACSRPGTPDDLPAVAASYGPPEACGLGLILGDESGGGSLVPLSPAPVLEYLLVSASLGAASPGVSVSTIGFTVVPPGFLGGVQLDFEFSDRHDVGNIPIGYFCWVRVGTAPTGAMGTPLIAGPASALPGAYGPVVPGYVRDGITPGLGYTVQKSAGNNTPLLLDRGSVQGAPAGAFCSIPLQPEDVIYARLDAYMLDGTLYTYYASTTIGPWAVQPVVMTFAPTLDPPAGAERTSLGDDGVADETEDPPGHDDVYLSCYVSEPPEIHLTVSVTATGGKAGSAIVLTLKIDDVDQTLTGPTDNVWSNSAPVVVTLGSTHTYEATWTQAEDERGPEVTHTESGSITIPSLCP
ncbi:MAG TPA: hypothetical protein VGO11_19545 [Chthoniobacteraceae bacterium]|jgi:hypothetical protein|nr:hypothetical protein [Chthoniobacteraceae bacterium]